MKEGDPLFTNALGNNFTISPSSIARDAGTDLGSSYNLDILGVARPQGPGWDIGAYEYIVSTRPSPPTGLRIVDQ